MPSEFVDSEYFVLLLKEANKRIRPDSRASLYYYIEQVYDQLFQFKTSMEVQITNYFIPYSTSIN